jgi:hypothetical protein
VRFSCTALFYSKPVKDVETFLGFTSWGYVSTIDSRERTIWIVDAHRDDGKRYIVRADEKLTALWNSNPYFEPSRLIEPQIGFITNDMIGGSDSTQC